MKINPRNKALGEFIKNKRIEHSISIDDISNQINISKNLYVKYESGEKSIYIDHLFLISAFFNLETNLLFNVYMRNV